MPTLALRTADVLPEALRIQSSAFLHKTYLKTGQRTTWDQGRPEVFEAQVRPPPATIGGARATAEASTQEDAGAEMTGGRFNSTRRATRRSM